MIAAFVAVSAVFVSCDKDDDAPSINVRINGTDRITHTVEAGEQVTVVVEYDAPGRIRRIEFEVVGGTNVTGFPKTSGFLNNETDRITLVWNLTGDLPSGATDLGTLASGTHNFTTRITDGNENSANRQISITVNAGAAHVAVTDITGVPTTATIGTPLTLTGTVVPETATNKTIAWSVVTEGTTAAGAAITGGNILNATGAGNVVVMATVANGLTATTPYTKNFTIAVGGGALGSAENFSLARPERDDLLQQNATVGIRWVDNLDATQARFAPTSGTTMVEITQAIHAGITTQAGLKAAYDAVPSGSVMDDASRITVGPAGSGFTQRYFITKRGDDHFLLHMLTLTFNAGVNTATFSFRR
jgi:hypothetical protein